MGSGERCDCLERLPPKNPIPGVFPYRGRFTIEQNERCLIMAEKPDEKAAEKPQPQERKGDRPRQPGFGRGGERERPTHKGRPQQAPQKAIVSASGKEVRGVVRLAGKDLNGALPIRRAITSVRGIGVNLGSVISQITYEKLGFNDKTMVGELDEQEVEKLEHILSHPQDYGVPARMLNRRKDLLSGRDMHAIGSDLAYMVKQDIDHEKDSYTYRGYRHTYGQKVRGQHTRSTGRTGMTVGVLRKAVLAKAGAAAQAGATAQAAGAAAPAAGAKAPAAAGAKAPAAPSAAPKAQAAAPKKEEPKK
jgi:small subunit ribosomal protein S13